LPPEANTADALHVPLAQSIGTKDMEDNSFDVVLCRRVLCRITHRERLIDEMVRLCRRHLVLIEPNRYNPATLVGVLLGTVEGAALEFSPDILARIVQRDGVRIRTALAYGTMPLPFTPSPVVSLLEHLQCRRPGGWDSVVFAEKAVTIGAEELAPSAISVPGRFAWNEPSAACSAASAGQYQYPGSMPATSLPSPFRIDSNQLNVGL
jgi:SAM-dependent methyltransferase